MGLNIKQSTLDTADKLIISKELQRSLTFIVLSITMLCK